MSTKTSVPAKNDPSELQRLEPQPCALTPDQAKKWGDTRAALSWHCPAFTHIFYTMLNNSKSEHIAIFSKDVPIAATDGSALILNPDGFFKLNLYERVFVCAHEILHCIWNHCGMMHGFRTRKKVSYPDGSELPYEHKTMNIAMDLVINDLLIEASKQAGQSCGTMPQGGCHDTKIATGKDSVIDAYAKVFKEIASRGGYTFAPGFDVHLAPGSSQGKDPQQAVSDRNQQEWDTQIQAAADVARAQGKLPAGLDQFFKNLLDPQVDWKDKIQAFFARRVGSGSFDWRRPDRRLIVRDIYAPGRSGHGAGTIVVGIDTSGSIVAEPATLDMFMAELHGILEELRPKNLILMWCDAHVHNTDECDDPSDLMAIRRRGVGGGGGTDFIPVFKKIEEMDLDLDALIYLTDGYGSFPDRVPNYPVLWGAIVKDVKYPFGEVVDIPKQARKG